MSREDREKLKQEYKEHYKLLLEQKKRLAEYERKAKIMKSLREIDPSPVLESFQGALQKVREKIVQAEARLEVYMDERAGQASAAEAEDIEQAETFMRKQQASAIVQQIKADMGTIERGLDEDAARMNVAKTIETGAELRKETGTNKKDEDLNIAKQDPARNDESVHKTIGRKVRKEKD